jgi:hypothetical protein
MGFEGNPSARKGCSEGPRLWRRPAKLVGGRGIPPSPHMKKSISFDIGFFILENGT